MTLGLLHNAALDARGYKAALRLVFAMPGA